MSHVSLRRFALSVKQMKGKRDDAAAGCSFSFSDSPIKQV